MKLPIGDYERSLVAALSLLLAVMLFATKALCWAFEATLPTKSLTKTEEMTKKGSSSSSMIMIILLLATGSFIEDSPPTHGGLADLLQGFDPALEEILTRVPSIQQGPQPPWFLANRHVQFIPYLIQNEIHKTFLPVPFERIYMNVTDCEKKPCHDDDDTSRTLADVISLDIFPPLVKPDSNKYPQFNASSPIILYAPGLRGSSRDMPGNTVIRQAFQKGMRSVVVNRRGHTPYQRMQSPRWHLFGDVDDFEAAYWFVKEKLLEQNTDTPLLLYCISSGCAMTSSALSQWDKRRRLYPGRKSPSFVASVDVSQGFDLERGLKRDRIQWPYGDILTAKAKRHFVVQNERLLRSHDSRAVDEMLAASEFDKFVDAGIGFAGYENKLTYQRNFHSMNGIREITTPRLMLNSKDDPCCNIQNLYSDDNAIRQSYDEIFRQTQNVIVAVSQTGSHCPFLSSNNQWWPLVPDPVTGFWMLNSWADQVTVEYFAAALDVYDHR